MDTSYCAFIHISVRMCVQVGSVDASQSAKPPLSVVPPIPYASEDDTMVKVQVSDSVNMLELGNS